MDGEMTKSETGNNMTCKCPHHKVTAVLIILIAVAFLLKAYGVLSAGTVDVVWPILLGLIGLKKLSKGMCKCCSGHGNGCGNGKCC